MRIDWLRRTTRAVACLIALVAASATGLAQSATDGAIAGTITDPQGLAIVGAQVVIHSLATNAEQTATTDSAGFFRVVHLQPSTYTVTISAAGFLKYQSNQVLVEGGQLTDISNKLVIGSTTQ